MRSLKLARRPAPADVACVGGFAVSLMYPLAMTPVTPWLLASHPLLLEALLGSISSLVTAGAFARVGRAAFWLVVAAPLLTDLLDPFSWWLGRRYGKRLLEMGKANPKYKPSLELAERFFGRWGGWAVAL